MSSHMVFRCTFRHRQVWIPFFAVLLITSALSVIPVGFSGNLSRVDEIALATLPSATMNYSITIAPSSVRVVRGGSVSSTVTITSIGILSQPVTLNSSGAPAGVTVYFAPNRVTPPSGGSVNSTITVNVLPTTAPGNYSIDVISTVELESRHTTMTVEVIPPDFGIACVPNPLIIQQGDTGRSTCTITSIYNFNTTISFSSSTWVGTPPTYATFSPPSDVWPPVNGTVQTVLIIYTSSTGSTGTFTFRVIGTGGSITRSADLSVQIEAGTRDFAISTSPESLSITPGGSATSTVTVQSVGVFSEPVDLTVSGAPSGLTTSFATNPVIPPGGGVAHSVLTLTAAGAPIGTHSITITGTSGTLSHSTTLTVQVMSSGGGCLIATATYGSELSNEVQFLRNFRDKSIMKTNAGSNFMVTFNAFYYSFSPTVAQFIQEHQNARTIAKFVLYPLMGILRIGAAVFDLFPTNREAAAVTAGLLVSALMGVVYLGLPLTGVLACSSRARRVAKRLQLLGLAILVMSIVAVASAEIYGISGLLMVTTSTMVAATFAVSGLIASRMIQGFRTSIEKFRTEAKLPHRK